MHLRIKLATTAFAAGALVATLAPAPAPSTVVTPSLPAPTPTSVATVELVAKSSTRTKPRALRVAVRAWGGVPKSKLRRQQPKQTKRWKKRAARALNASLRQQYTPPKHGYIAAFNFWGCAFALTRFVAEFGIPIGKVFRVVKEAWKLFRSVGKMREAARNGTLLKMMGEDSAEVVKAVLGAGDLLNECIL